MIRVCEFIQRSGDGGHPVTNGGPFAHGEPVLVVSKRDLATLAHLILKGTSSMWVLSCLEQLQDLGKDFVKPLEG